MSSDDSALIPSFDSSSEDDDEVLGMDTDEVVETVIKSSVDAVSARDSAIKHMTSSAREDVLKLAADYRIDESDPVWILIQAVVAVSSVPAQARQAVIEASKPAIDRHRADLDRLAAKSLQRTSTKIDDALKSTVNVLEHDVKKLVKDIAKRNSKQSKNTRLVTALSIALLTAAALGYWAGTGSMLREQIEQAKQKAEYFDLYQIKIRKASEAERSVIKRVLSR